MPLFIILAISPTVIETEYKAVNNTVVKMKWEVKAMIATILLMIDGGALGVCL